MTPADLLVKIETMAKAVYDAEARVREVCLPHKTVLVVAWPGTEQHFDGPTLGAAAGQAARIMRDLAQRQRAHAEQALRDVALAERTLEQLVSLLEPA